MGFVRLVVILAVVLTVVYWSVSIYSRSVRREALEDAFDEEHPNGGAKGARDAYIANGMAAYETGLRKKLIWLVYVIPVLVVTGILIVTNTN